LDLKTKAFFFLASLIVSTVPLTGQSIELQLVAAGVNRPIAITHAGDGTNRAFISLQTGQILIYNGTQVLPTPFLDINPLIDCCNERGLLGTVFHPDYVSNGFFYVSYTDTSGDTVVARYSVSGNPNIADRGSAGVVLTVTQPFANHNGGNLQFGPDGYLYIGLGDGGSQGDPQNNAQNPMTLLGKMLRIDVDAGPPYAIPPDNPFVGDPNVLDEIWALGFRNPWRYSFDRQTGDLFVADVGQSSREEVDFQPASSPGGENYGWRLMEGTSCFNPPSNCNDGTLTLPILEYTHSLGCSITGGFRYRGAAIPPLSGVYLYADYCSGRIWGATETAPGQWTSTVLLDTNLAISAFGEDEAGELFIAHHSSSGAVYRVVSSELMFHTLDPCRVIDTRNPDGPLGGPALTAGADRTFAVAGACGIPSAARALSVNVAITGPTQSGNLRLHPGGTPVPLVSSINYSSGQTRSNNAVVPLGPSGGLAVFCGQASGRVHFILDVNGYFQ
jgi:glucose/arabinose dehydrogenase